MKKLCPPDFNFAPPISRSWRRPCLALILDKGETPFESFFFQTAVFKATKLFKRSDNESDSDQSSYMFVPNLKAMSHVTSVLGPENHPKSLVQKAVLFKNGLSTAKNISHGYMS